MGNLLTNRNNENKEPEENYKLDDILCSKCGEIPEILYVHKDNNKIELKCKNCGEYEILIDNYYKELTKKNYFRNCKICNKNENIYYCYDCNNNLCQKCKNKDNPKAHNKEHKFIIKLDEKKDFCPKHSKIFNHFCNDCKENFCDEELENEHIDHEIVDINPEDGQYNTYYKYIEEMNENLKMIVNFNKLVINTGNYFKNNYFHLKSIINLAKSYQESNKRNSKDVKYLLKGLSKDVENSKKAKNILEEKKTIYLRRDNKFIILNDRELGNQYFKYISQIRFNQLKEIDISGNKIDNIEPFKFMSLPFLEFLNLSNNEIKDLDPIENLDSKNLQYLFLHINNISNIEILEKVDFPKVKILRLEENNINKDDRSFQNLKNKFKEILINPFEDQKKEFKSKYGIDISENITKIDLSDKKGGEEMLKYLFLILTYKTKNEIKELILRNNNIKDPSILNRINFTKLKILDLSVNRITNLDFLLDMKAKYLNQLFLDNNCINDIYPLANSNFQFLKVLSLNKNNFFYKEMDLESEYNELNELLNKTKNNNKNIEIQLVENDEKYYRELIEEIQNEINNELNETY